MTLTLSNARIIDPEAGTDRMGSVVISEGRIVSVGGSDTAGEVRDCGGKCLAPGIIDIGVKIGEPGERHKESYPQRRPRGSRRRRDHTRRASRHDARNRPRPRR